MNVPGKYHFDVICHSRGGLLARALAELTDNEIGGLLGKKRWKRPTGVSVTFDQIVFVATPNTGTDLAAPRNLPVVLDRIANVINFLPDSAITLGLGGFLSVASDVAAMGLRELAGLADQSPRSKFLNLLNSPRASSPPGKGYFGVRSNYTPDGGLVKALLDKGVDALFQGKENDLIVPTHGVSETPEFKLPDAQVRTYGVDTPDNVPHTGFFQKEETWKHIKKCLAIP
jgi:hypothetical protein